MYHWEEQLKAVLKMIKLASCGWSMVERLYSSPLKHSVASDEAGQEMKVVVRPVRY